MKKVLLAFFFTLLFVNNSEAQFLDKLKKKVEEKAEELLNKKKSSNTDVETQEEDPEKTSIPTSKTESETNQTNASVTVWRNYKFIPGEKVVYYDDLKTEEVGEFPSRWDLQSGGAEVATFNNEKVIIGTAKYENKIFPLFKDESYLSDEFTIEFDIYVDELSKEYNNSWVDYNIYLTRNNFTSSSSSVADIELGLRSGVTNGYVVKYDFQLEEVDLGNYNGWHHIALSYYKGKLKLYYDEKRIANMPNLSITPDSFGIDMNAHKDGKLSNKLLFGIRNVRIAHGGGQMYQRIIADGNYTTNGILFDSGKAEIKPQSMGIINKILTIMNEYPDSSYHIIGHTDSDGSAEDNLMLSKLRAEAIKAVLVENGIESDRLTTEGKGESELLTPENSNEAKANNRRVQFVKI